MSDKALTNGYKGREAESRYPVLFQGMPLIITERERELIDAFIYCQDVNVAAEKSGLSEKYAREFLGSPRMKEYVAFKVNEVATRNSVTLESVLTRLAEIAFGKIKVSKMEIEALKVLAEYVKIKSPHQTNIGIFNSGSRHELPEDKLDALINERLKLLEKNGNGISPEIIREGEGGTSGCLGPA